jgi:hypothetical protein
MKPTVDSDVASCWMLRSRNRLAQFLKYAQNVYDLPQLLRQVHDRRPRPQIPTFTVLLGLCFAAAFRCRSFNAMEGHLREKGFQRLLGRRVSPGKKAFSADTVARVADGLDDEALRAVQRRIIGQAERNKVFREGWPGALRCVALDGWEVFCSRRRHCDDCLTRTVHTQAGDEIEYYHRVVVALLLGEKTEVVLDLEPVRSLRGRRAAGEANATTDEGEKTAARRLIQRLHESYGGFLAVLVLDGLYPDGPTLTAIAGFGYSAVITLRKTTDEPLKEALALWDGQLPHATWEDLRRCETIRAWDCPELRTLDTFDGPLRVLRAEVTSRRSGQTTTWCAVVLGEIGRRLSPRRVHEIQRARWHEENTAFHQWTTQWHLGRAYRHSPGGVRAVLRIWTLTFNLMQLFCFRRLRRPRHPRDPSDTLCHLVGQMILGLGVIPAALPWAARGG